MVQMDVAICIILRDAMLQVLVVLTNLATYLDFLKSVSSWYCKTGGILASFPGSPEHEMYMRGEADIFSHVIMT